VRLIAAGRDANEPAAVIADATSQTQSVQVTTLANLGEAAGATTAPAMLVIGENVRLREALDWVGGKVLNPYPLGRAALDDVG
jgi:siroheme synthase